MSARMKRALMVTGAVAVVAIVGVAALSAGSGGPVTGTATVGGPAPEVTLTDFEGESFSLQDYEGRPVVMNFWASWCPFCAAEMPDFEKVHRSVAEDVTFLGIDQCESCQGGSRDAAERLASEAGVSYRLAEDPNGSVFVAFGGSSMPTTIFIDVDGRVVESVGGMLSEGQLRDYIARLFGVGDA
ncbi:MAG: TlpA family protein disulfide reductase [Actinomycetota bacterium]